jgi:hypothetical protein
VIGFTTHWPRVLKEVIRNPSAICDWLRDTLTACLVTWLGLVSVGWWAFLLTRVELLLLYWLVGVCCLGLGIIVVSSSSSSRASSLTRVLLDLQLRLSLVEQVRRQQSARGLRATQNRPSKEIPTHGRRVKNVGISIRCRLPCVWQHPRCSRLGTMLECGGDERFRVDLRVRRCSSDLGLEKEEGKGGKVGGG